jgi:hypothetical protein
MVVPHFGIGSSKMESGAVRKADIALAWMALR